MYYIVGDTLLLPVQVVDDLFENYSIFGKETISIRKILHYGFKN